MAKLTTLDLLKQHAPITTVLFQVVEQVRGDQQLSDALDDAAKDPKTSNIGVRFLSKRRAYEVTLVFDASSWAQDVGLT